MDDRILLGIPDRSTIDAPARRFALIEERSRVSSSASAILLVSWGLLLKQVFGSGKEEAPLPSKTDFSHPATAAQPEAEAAAVPSTAERTPGSSELARAFGLVSVSMNEAFEPAVDLDKLKFAKTDVPRLSLVPANQNVPAVARPQLLAAEANHGRGGGGGGGGGGSEDGRGKNHGDDPRKPTPGSKDLPPSDPPKRVNKAPVSAGSVDLGSGLVNESIIISLSQLLTGTSDPDGDALTVQSLQVDHGSLQVLGPDRWLFTPEHDETGTVEFSYRVTDGVASIVQTAHADLHPAPDEDIHGTEGDDFVIGTPRNDVIDASAGNDIVYGREGNDTIYGRDGNDHIVGGAGDDILLGGPGNDIIFGGAGNDALFGEGGNDILYGEDGNDLILGGDGDDFASGGQGNDTIMGGSGNDRIDGGAGDDHIDGGDGNDVIVLSVDGGHDVITGGSGNDTMDLSQIVFDVNVDLPDGIVEICDGQTAQIFEIENVRGGQGRDRLVGDAHVNIMEGGDGDDTFVFRDLASLKNDGGPRDHIVDFSVGDKLDLSRVGQELDDFAGQKLFFAGADRAKFDEVGAVTYRHEIVSDAQEITVVTCNLDGNPDHEFEIVLDGNIELNEGNFVLAANLQSNAHHGA